jgi:hypothetical protein
MHSMGHGYDKFSPEVLFKRLYAHSESSFNCASAACSSKWGQPAPTLHAPTLHALVLQHDPAMPTVPLPT